MILKYKTQSYKAGFCLLLPQAFCKPALWPNQISKTQPVTFCFKVSMVSSGYATRLWSQDLHPQYWSKYQVWEWLQQTLDVHQIDATSIPFSNFDLDGRQLCSMSYQDFTHLAGSVGPVLYQSLTDLKWGSKF